ncbi:MAG: hypothetical protein M3O70_26460 [Actinomycetota bacterium]|nr:hypothetical protein [Actinomycetota bacterium]
MTEDLRVERAWLADGGFASKIENAADWVWQLRQLRKGTTTMGLAINVDRVVSVLLADGWHEVAPRNPDDSRSSFIIDAYEYVTPHIRQEDDAPAVWQNDDPGFAFAEADGKHWIVGPLTAIMAIRYRGYGT